MLQRALQYQRRPLVFKCGICGKSSKKGKKINRKVVETREKEYYEKRYDEDRNRERTVYVGKGSEIIKEIPVCSSCV